MTPHLQTDSAERPPVALSQLAAAQAKIGLVSFGGGTSALVFHEFVVRRGWLTEEEFFRGLTICQILPGTNVANLAIFVGQRLRGVSGAIVSLVGLLIFPFFAVIGFGIIYARIVGLPWASAALDGVTAAAIGLLAMIVVRGVRTAPSVAGVAVLVATALAVGVLGLPLIPVVGVIAPISIGLVYLRRAGRG